MTVPFQNVPGNLRTPLFYAEVNASQANTAQQSQRALLIGQMTGAGALTANVAQLSSDSADGKVKAGPGSILAQMNYAYRKNDTFGEVWLLGLSDVAGAVAATGSITLAGAPTAGGTVALYIAGELVSQPVTTAQTAAQVASALVSTINGMLDLPVTAAIDGANPGKVDLTAKNAGLCGADIDLRLNYQGAANGEATPAGLTPTIAAMAGGATNPSLTTALANLNNEPFDFIACALTDPASMAALSAFLNDQTGRWSWSTQVYGHCFYAYRGTVGGLTTFGTTLNDQHATVMGVYDSPSPMWKWAAGLAGAAAVSLRADPGTPLQTLTIAGVLAPPLVSRFPLSLRNTLLYDGISTFTVTSSGAVQIENCITTYQKNALGQADNSYLEIETMFLLMYVLRFLAGIVTSKYARVKLAADGTRFGTGANVVTPSTIKADIIAGYRELEDGGFVQNSAAFAANLVVQQNATNPNRVDVLYPAVLIDQLRIFAVLAQFALS